MVSVYWFVEDADVGIVSQHWWDELSQILSEPESHATDSDDETVMHASSQCPSQFVHWTVIARGYELPASDGVN